MSGGVFSLIKLQLEKDLSCIQCLIFPVQCKTEYVYSVIGFALLYQFTASVRYICIECTAVFSMPMFHSTMKPNELNNEPLQHFASCLSHCRVSSRNLLEGLPWEMSLHKWGYLWIGRILHMPSRTYWTLLHKERYVCGTVSVWQHVIIATTWF